MQVSEAPKVSIITCFLNTELYLEQAIQSVIQQKYNQWELLLIDDGSSDNSSNIANHYASKYPGNIFYYEHEGHKNKGLSASRNLGIKQSTGEYVSFLDADDIWFPEYLMKQVEILRQYPASMVCEATEYWYSWNNSNNEDIIIPIGVKQNALFSPPQLMLELYPLGKGAAPCVCGILVKKAILSKHGGFDESFTGMYEDQVFLSKFYLNEAIYISSLCNNRYRQRFDSLMGTTQQFGGYHEIRKQFLKWFKKYLSDSDLNFPEVNTLLQQALLPLPLVSVIITFLNDEQFLGEAIESVLNQDYTNWELLLVDDGSRNASTEIAKKFTTAYPEKIFYLEHEGHINKGLSASRNLGIANAKGKFIAFLDADDIWLPQKLSNQVAILLNHSDVGMVAEGSIHWYSWNEPQRKDIPIHIGVTSDNIYEPNQLLYKLYPLGRGAAPGPCSWLLTKEAITRVGGFEESFNKQYQLYEDQAFLCKIYLHEKVYVSSSCNNWYRQRPDSIVKWVKEKGHYHTVRQYFLEFLQNYINQQKIFDKHLNQLLKKALLPYHRPIIYFFTNTAPNKVWHLSKKAIPSTIKRFIKSQIIK